MKPVRLLLDATAVRAFPSVDIGEPITQVQENGGAFAVPLPSIVAARDTDDRMIRLLLGHPAHRVLELPALDAWPQMAAMADVLGSFDLAVLLWLSTVHGCDVLTGDPKPWRALGDDPPIIPFG